MSAVTALFCLIVCFLVCSCAAQENIKAKHGEDITLRCKADNNKPIIAVEWKRPGLHPDDYVLFYRDGKYMSEYQHRYFVNRVDLQDREMKNGDVSLILKDVKMEDEGTYECHVVQSNRRKRFILKSDPISTFNLEVLPPGDKNGGAKVGGDKNGGAKVGGDKAGIILGVVGLMLLLVF